MKVKLEVGERISAIPSVMPKEGNALLLTIVKHILKKCDLTPEEITKWEIQTIERTPGVTSYSWNPAKVEETELEFTDAESDIIRKELNKLDQQNKLNFSTLQIYEKFCNPKPT